MEKVEKEPKPSIEEEYIEKIMSQAKLSREVVLKMIAQKKQEKGNLKDVVVLYLIKKELGLDFSISRKNEIKYSPIKIHHEYKEPIEEPEIYASESMVCDSCEALIEKGEEINVSGDHTYCMNCTEWCQGCERPTRYANIVDIGGNCYCKFCVDLMSEEDDCQTHYIIEKIADIYRERHDINIRGWLRLTEETNAEDIKVESLYLEDHSGIITVENPVSEFQKKNFLTFINKPIAIIGGEIISHEIIPQTFELRLDRADVYLLKSL